jgi:hypothetical protein
MKDNRFRVLLFAFVLAFAVGVCAAKTSSSVPASKTAPQAMHQKAKADHSQKSLVLAAPENLSGTIAAVYPSDNVISVVGTNGVSYDFRVTKKTQIERANQKVSLAELKNDLHDPASIHFVPQANGNRAETIQIKAS